MFALLALIVITSAETITIPITKDDNGKYYTFFSGDIGECYLVNYTSKHSRKYEKKDDKYMSYIYNSVDCSGTVSSETEVTEYKKGDMEPAYSTFDDDNDECFYGIGDDYNPYKTQFTTECVTVSGITMQQETKGDEIKVKVYSDSKCEGDYTETSLTCDECEQGTYVYCGSSINSIMVIALAVLLILL
ncbi:hypothetical protein QTN25_004216 [Entamoeba marina]